MTPRKSSATDRLASYRRKRSADRTPEPFSGAADRPRLFVVQKHAARNMHYDLRLEIGGALHSWAVPKGPTFDPAEKRLAVEVEEHPLEYADFEGLIPEGNYGAGAVIVWDRGRWESIGDPQEGLVAGKLLFDLHGYKLRGRWTLFRTKRSERDWLLMKKPDGYADPEESPGEESIHSGLTVEELRDGADPSAAIRSRLSRKKTPKAEVRPASVRPMLARTAERVFSREGWLFELKYDGFRLLCARQADGVLLRYRRGMDATAIFPEIATALRALPHEQFLLDGEVVVLDETGRPVFGRLQQRVHLSRASDIARATVELPATLFAFDLLSFGPYDLRGLPLIERKRLLRRLLPPEGPLRYSDHVEREGEAMFDEVRRMRLEGIVAKRSDAPYESGRSGNWLKMRADRADDFVVVGYSPPKRGRAGFGALHVAVCEPEGLVYAGRVGTGFSDRQLSELRDELDAIRADEPACAGPLPRSSGHVWVEPRTVVEVRYKEMTADGLLRQPVFLRMRHDKPVEECIRPDASGPRAEPAQPVEPPVIERKVSFTNLTKLFWPEEGYTKGDLIDYYRSVSDRLLPYLEDRPVVLTRYPDGIDGKNFFQKDAPGYIPDWVRTERMWSEHAQREIHYFICDSEETLLYLINLGSIPLHLWASRVADLQHPDWCILDLDPKDAPFEQVVRIARAIRTLADEIELECFVKTSGSTGLHVLFPLGAQCTYEQARSLGEVLARTVATELPEIATLVRRPSARGGKVYIDYLQNGHGRLLVSPFCVRPLPAAPVSTPLRWSEVKPSLDIRRHTIRSVPRRLRTMKTDPFAGILTAQPDLPGALARLERRLDR